MGLMKNLFREVVLESIKVPDHLKKWIDIDIENIRIFVAHEVIIRGIEIISEKPNSDLVIDELTLSDNAYLFKLSKSSNKFTISIQPSLLTLDKDSIEFKAFTPGGLEYDSKPILTILCGVMLNLFGNTDLGEALISRNLPIKLRWDGRTAIIKINRDDFPVHLRKIPAFPMVTQIAMEQRGLWLSFDSMLTLSKIFSPFIAYIINIFCGGRSVK